MSNDKIITENTILLGDDADQFFNSDLGKYVMERAKEEVEANTEYLKKCDPNDSREIIRMQTNIRVAEGALVWMAEALSSGRELLQMQMENDE